MPKLLDRLRKARAVAKTKDEAVLKRFIEIEDELKTMKDVVPREKQWEQNMSNQLNALERRLDKVITGKESSSEGFMCALDDMAATIQQIKVSIEQVRKLMPLPKSKSTETGRSEPEFEFKQSEFVAQEIATRRRFLAAHTHDMNKNPVMDEIWKCYAVLESIELKMCCLSMSIFPQDAVMKKRTLIYWWIGEGFIPSRTQDKTAEEVGEEFFHKLLTLGFIQPHVDSTDANKNAMSLYPLVVNKCTMHPWIRFLFINLSDEAGLFYFNDQRLPYMPYNYDSIDYASSTSTTFRRACLVFDPDNEDDHTGPEKRNSTKVEGKIDHLLLTVFNVNEQYLRLKPERLSKMKKVAVLQLGRWESSPGYHIEVEDEGFLKGLGGHQNMHLKFLSLRGIAQITQLPPCIFKIISLEILDLRACHNLETLPEDISSLRNLTHFDISECYFLDRMPKGIDKLSSLQVLKGYNVFGDLKRTSCRLGDFAKLKNLRRLAIHMGNEAVVHDGEFNELEKIASLRRLKISWGVVTSEKKEKIALQSSEFSFPPALEKLDLQGIPIEQVPQWLNPSKLKNLKKLYIRGGKLADSLNHRETDDQFRWTVEVLRLKYLSKLKNIEFEKLKQEFPRLRYLEKIQCGGETRNECDDDIVWSEGGAYI